MLQAVPRLADQIYDAIVDEICNGQIAPGTHLVQESLAERFGVSRQPIQQAMGRLKADGVIEEAGRRGLFVTPIEPVRMRDHYGVRAALDAWAARAAARRLAAGAARGSSFGKRGREILRAGRSAVAAGDVAAQVRHDVAFHFLVYEVSGNALLPASAEPHWRYLRRAMGDVLRRVERPDEIWRQHRAIFEAVRTGEAESAARLALAHAEDAATRLGGILEASARSAAGEK